MAFKRFQAAERVHRAARSAIQSAIVEHVAPSFSAPVPEEQPPAPPAPVAAAAVKSEATSESRAGVVTTADEIAVWESIASWIREVKPNAPLAYRDSKSYLTIHQSNVRKWFLRVNVQSAPFWLGLRHVSADEVRRLAPGMDLIDGGNLGDSRVSLKSLGDVPKLRAAIIASCERETGRKAEDAEVEKGDDG